jgi:hypothetical protein
MSLLALPSVICSQAVYCDAVNASVSRLRDLREDMPWLLATLAAMNVLAALSVATLRGIVLRIEVGSVKSDDSTFPREFVFLYGLYLTALLGAIYLPTTMSLDARGRELAASIVHDPNDVKSFKEVEDALVTHGAEAFQTIAGVLAPVVASVLAIAAGKVTESGGEGERRLPQWNHDQQRPR